MYLFFTIIKGQPNKFVQIYGTNKVTEEGTFKYPTI